MKKKITLLLVLLMVGTLLFGCAATTEPQEAAPKEVKEEVVEEVVPEKTLPKIRIGWAPPNITGVFATATDFMNKAAEDAAKNGLDVEIIVKAMADETQIQNQINNIENFVQQEVDCIVISPGDTEAVKPAIRMANEKGIPVILVNLLDKQDDIEVAAYIGFDNVIAGKVSAYSLLDALGGPGVLGEGEKVAVDADTYLDLAKWEEIYADFDYTSITADIALIEGIAGNFYSNARLEGMHYVLDKCTNINIKATLPADWDRQKGIAAAENILQSNPNLDAIWAASNEMGMGAAIAAKNMDRADGLTIITNDGTPESIEFINRGELVAETWHGFPEWGWYGTKFAVQLAFGQEIEQLYDIRPRTEYAGNADNFYPNTKLEDIDWQGIIDAYMAE